MELVLYACTGGWPNGCGFVSTINFRDSCCPVCKTCMKVDKITISGEALNVKIEPAPHTKTDD